MKLQAKIQFFQFFVPCESCKTYDSSVCLICSFSFVTRLWKNQSTSSHSSLFDALLLLLRKNWSCITDTLHYMVIQTIGILFPLQTVQENIPRNHIKVRYLKKKSLISLAFPQVYLKSELILLIQKKRDDYSKMKAYPQVNQIPQATSCLIPLRSKLRRQRALKCQVHHRLL